jgi:hypothetical protein
MPENSFRSRSETVGVRNEIMMNNPLDFCGKVALVTGAAAGMGADGGAGVR